MTDTEKLNALVDYIRDAERFHLDNAKKGLVESSYKSMAVQDIQVFMEHKLGIEHKQQKSLVRNNKTNQKNNLINITTIR